MIPFNLINLRKPVEIYYLEGGKKRQWLIIIIIIIVIKQTNKQKTVL